MCDVKLHFGIEKKNYFTFFNKELRQRKLIHGNCSLSISNLDTFYL